MKVFISWSGQRSEALATAVREWLPLVLHYVEPWVSKADIQAGERWSIEIAKELEGSNFGIICVTKENVNAPWILFEAGALAKSMQDGRVIPLLLDLDVKDISGPLAQFQAKKVDAAGIRQLTVSLNKAAATPVPDAQLDRLFGALWSDLDKQIAEIPKVTTPAKQARPQGEILEELVAGFRGLELRVRDIADADAPRRIRRQAKMPMALIHHVTKSFGGAGNGLGILIAASVVRESAPWVYELAAEAYRAEHAGNEREMAGAYRRLHRALSLAIDSPIRDILGDDQFILFEIREIIETAPVMRASGADLRRGRKMPYSRERHVAEDETKKGSDLE